MKQICTFIFTSFIFLSCNQEETKNYKDICKEFDNLAIEQKQILEEIRVKYNSDKNFIKRLNEEQISWIQFQDKRLRALYPNDWDSHYRKIYGKETFNACKCKELIRLSRIRNNDLKVYLVGDSDCPAQGNE